MVVDFFFITESQPHQCYLVLSLVIIIILLYGPIESPFDTFTSNDGKVTTLEWSYWPYNRFYSYHLSKIRNKHILFF